MGMMRVNDKPDFGVIKCPYCNSEEVIDPQPNANQGPSSRTFKCGTEIVYLSSVDSVEWDCRDGERPKRHTLAISSTDREEFRELLKRLSRL